MFDYSNFPLYANTIFNPEDMFHFFWEKRDEKICKVKRTITKLLNSNDKELVEHYKEIAFMGQEGIGQSHMSIKWHRKLAEWLEQVIQSDPVIDDYVKGDPDPYYPGSSVRVSELNLIEFISDADKIYPEDVQNNLAIIEWYLQKVSCEIIASGLQPKILSMCKRIFLGA